jgi:hypothetical protein
MINAARPFASTGNASALSAGPMQDLDNWVVYPLMGRALENEVL